MPIRDRWTWSQHHQGRLRLGRRAGVTMRLVIVGADLERIEQSEGLRLSFGGGDHGFPQP